MAILKRDFIQACPGSKHVETIHQPVATPKCFSFTQHPRCRKARLEKDSSFEEGGAHWPMWAIHLEGAMGASQSVLMFKLAASGESLTAQSGLALVGEYLRAMGIGGLIHHELPGPGSAAGYGPSVHVLARVLMLAGGGRTLEDLRVLRGDEGLRSLLRLDEMPSSDATGDWLRRMGGKESGVDETCCKCGVSQGKLA
jgi:hypothetical protein